MELEFLSCMGESLRGHGVHVNRAQFPSRNGALAHSARHDLANANFTRAPHILVG